MPVLSANFETVPDKVLPVPSGIYSAKIVRADIEPNKTSKEKGPDAPGAGQNLVTELELVSDNELASGRKMTTYTSTKMLTGLKRIFLSSGAPISDKGADTNDLLGKVCRIIVAPNTYKDQATGKMIENTQIKDYLIPNDDGYAV